MEIKLMNKTGGFNEKKKQTTTKQPNKKASSDTEN